MGGYNITGHRLTGMPVVLACLIVKYRNMVMSPEIG